jgi:hypothetical protein
MMALATAMVLATGCGKGDAGIEEAKRQAALQDQGKDKAAPPAKKMSTPVPGSAHVPCTTLIDQAAFNTALGEKEPIVVKETTEADAAASCSIVRGGKRPTEAEQQALLKQSSRLGVLAGDELCNISAYCWTIEDADRFRAKCAETKGKDDDTMGSFACVTITATGEDDVQSFRFFDADTKCILKVRGGPSMVDNDLIRKCAKVARDAIGPAQISITATPPAPAGSGSATAP